MLLRHQIEQPPRDLVVEVADEACHGQRLNALRDQIAGKLACIGGADSQLSNAARAANSAADTRQRVPLQREQIALGNDPGQRTITVNNNDMAEAVLSHQQCSVGGGGVDRQRAHR